MSDLAAYKALIVRANRVVNVQKIVNNWDGMSAAELTLDILVALGEDVNVTIEEAQYKWRRNLYPLPSEEPSSEESPPSC